MTKSIHITYFANDLSDPAIARRVRMLCVGGAGVKLLGFRRCNTPIREVEGISTVDLGQTLPGRLGDRCLKVLRRSLEAGHWREATSGADVLLARNLEMATIAAAARTALRLQVRLVYECLDIHGALLGGGTRAKLLRSWERQVLRRCAALIVSSQSFITNYFAQLDVDLPEIILVENKLMLPRADIARRPACEAGRMQPPWRIGWFGILRCTESFKILLALARRRPGLVQIELRGRPTQELQKLIAQHLPIEGMRFTGPYAQTDLAAIYGTCDMIWAIDYSQQGQNSNWLLPNRIYEGSYYNKPAIALLGTETAAWLISRQAGLLLRNPQAELDPFITGLTADHYRALQRSCVNIPTGDLAWTTQECRQLALRISGN